MDAPFAVGAIGLAAQGPARIRTVFRHGLFSGERPSP